MRQGKKRIRFLAAVLLACLSLSACAPAKANQEKDRNISGELTYESSMELLYAEKLRRIMYVLCTLISICPSKNFSAQFTIKTTLFDFYGVYV